MFTETHGLQRTLFFAHSLPACCLSAGRDSGEFRSTIVLISPHVEKDVMRFRGRWIGQENLAPGSSGLDVSAGLVGGLRVSCTLHDTGVLLKQSSSSSSVKLDENPALFLRCCDSAMNAIAIMIENKRFEEYFATGVDPSRIAGSARLMGSSLRKLSDD